MIQPLALHSFHQDAGAHFIEVSGFEAINHYDDPAAEHAWLWESAGVLDLSFRSRICLVGADRARFLHGQVTNDIKRLRAGEGCYAALVNAKGKMESDANIWCLQDELLLDFEPGLTGVVSARLAKYLVADDVEILDVAPLYGLLSVQGPRAETILRSLGWFGEVLPAPFRFVKAADPALAEIYLMNQPRAGTGGFDCFVPESAMATTLVQLAAAAKAAGGGLCGWQALEAARIEAGRPRFGQDMDGSNLPQENVGDLAVSYNKGCYIGQEILNRIHSFGHVNRELRGLRLANALAALPVKGDKLFHDGKEVGYITSALASSRFKANLALGYVRREANQAGTELVLRTASVESAATVVTLPFSASSLESRNAGT
jgi:folate-binding protein YgfZ